MWKAAVFALLTVLMGVYAMEKVKPEAVTTSPVRDPAPPAKEKVKPEAVTTSPVSAPAPPVKEKVKPEAVTTSPVRDPAPPAKEKVKPEAVTTSPVSAPAPPVKEKVKPEAVTTSPVSAPAPPAKEKVKPEAVTTSPVSAPAPPAKEKVKPEAVTTSPVSAPAPPAKGKVKPEAVITSPLSDPAPPVKGKVKPEAVITSPAGDPAPPPYRGKLLVVPMDGSHWVGVKALAQEMGRRGHNVTVVIPEVSMRMGPGKHYNTVTFPVPYSQDDLDTFLSAHKEVMDKSDLSFIEKTKRDYSRMQQIFNWIHTTAESLLFNDTLIAHLAEQGFDALLTDPMIPTGNIIARKFGLPTINMLRASPCSIDIKASGCPSPPSYVPRFMTGYTDKMNFKQRAYNTLVALMEPLMCRVLYWHFDTIALQFLGEKVGMTEVLSESDIWLMRFDFALELPRPLMPNQVLVAGINCNVRNPLPKDLESWVKGEHGFVVFTLGSMVSDMPEEQASMFLEVFRQIPQKVIWRYDGKIPDTVPENVKLMSWVPQNDLLAQPGARAFITHAGSHGLFEGLCHAVPMLMVPIDAEQFDNAERLASKGAGIILDLLTVTTEEVLKGLNEVINNPRYSDNMQRLSTLHKDRPVEPLDLSVFWTEFVMRHKGAKHLRSAVHDLNWFQYFSLDVFAFLAAVVLVFVVVTVKCFKLCCRKLSRKKKQE